MEVISQLQRMFAPDLRLVKKRIEDLIAREYLERDKDNPNVFRYLVRGEGCVCVVGAVAVVLEERG